MMTTTTNGRTRRRAARLTIGCLLVWALVSVPSARAEPNAFEKREIEAAALEAFRTIVTLWREELYFELYDLGSDSTRARVSKEEFAGRMVRLNWVPEGELNPEFLKAKFRFRTMVYVAARIRYRDKFNPESEFFKEQTFLLLKERGQWRIDLIKLVRAPFA